jgi:hypothetical protein
MANHKRRSGLKQIRWRVTLRGELLGHVYADNWPAACERAVRRWKISRRGPEGAARQEGGGCQINAKFW